MGAKKPQGYIAEMIGHPLKPTQKQIERMETEPVKVYNELYRKAYKDPEPNVLAAILRRLDEIKKIMALVIILLFVSCTTSEPTQTQPTTPTEQKCGTVLTCVRLTSSTGQVLNLWAVVIKLADNTQYTTTSTLPVAVGSQFCK